MRPFLGHGMVQRDSYLFGVQRGLGWTVFESPVRVQGEGTGGEIALRRCKTDLQMEQDFVTFTTFLEADSPGRLLKLELFSPLISILFFLFAQAKPF